jgi:hypothetical protein
LTNGVWLLLLIWGVGGRSLVARAQGQPKPSLRKISIRCQAAPLPGLLQDISRQGKFYFSYDSRLIDNDALVTLDVDRAEVGVVLERILPSGIGWKERGNYIYLQRSPVLTAATGVVRDALTGEPLSDATVYSPDPLGATLTNADGSFNLKMKSSKPYTLVVRRMAYSDTSILCMGGCRGLEISLNPELYSLDSFTVSSSKRFQNQWYSRLVTNARTRLLLLNLDSALLKAPYQLSLLPGLGTHGRMAPQVGNQLSINIIGGYHSYVDGFEGAGVFNITRNDAKYVQTAGVANLVGGAVTGFQGAGVYNQCRQVTGAQAAGVCNMALGRVQGSQLAGVANFCRDSVTGTQAAATINLAAGQVSGTQLSAGVNVALEGIEGLQLGLVNYTTVLKGVQLGLVNISDTADGCTIGLLNIVKHGYHRLGLHFNDVQDLELSLSTGTSNLYTILLAASNYDHPDQYSVGAGFGTQIRRWGQASLHLEATSQYLNLDSWRQLHLLNRAALTAQVLLARGVRVTGGPVYNVYVESKVNGDYRPVLPEVRRGGAVHDFDKGVRGWAGFQIGVSLF